MMKWHVSVPFTILLLTKRKTDNRKEFTQMAVYEKKSFRR